MLCRSTFAAATICLLAGAPMLRAADELPAVGAKETAERASYGIGFNIGQDLKKQKHVDVAAVMRGLQDALKGAKSQFTPEEIQAAMQALGKNSAAEWQKENEAWLATNAKAEGVKTLPSGLQYKVVKMGDGKKPKADDTVVTHYRGTLIDGTQFDSSYDRNQPATFPVNRVIPGWTEALQLMPTGSKWQLYIPSKLGYGPRGTPDGAIGPHSTLIFDIELLEIK